jgi:uncharacterized membrane protein YkvA (DUF1232 family)
MSWLVRPGLLRRLLSSARLVVRLVREPRVPVLVKIVPLAALAYVLSPIDLSPDFLPFLGQIDDLVFLIAASEVFLKLCPVGAATFHQSAIARGAPYSPMAATDEIIDAEWRRD